MITSGRAALLLRCFRGRPGISRRERDWLPRYISAPEEVLAQGDPVATALFNKYKKIGMPNLKLGASDVADLVSYLAAEAAAKR